MELSLSFENCSYELPCLIEESADSVLIGQIEFSRIPTIQSKRSFKREISTVIENALARIKWIISGPVQIEFTWFLNAVKRQETDKIGDLDNTSKAILDELTGPSRVLIDDSQIKGLYFRWLTRNQSCRNHSLQFKIDFNNEVAFYKKNLSFIKYYNAICLVVNLEMENKEEVGLIKQLIDERLKFRAICNASNFTNSSEYEFHLTRLNKFHNNILYYDNSNKTIFRRS
jgi:Holliday junction resolvase RusA-like endonuclease